MNTGSIIEPNSKNSLRNPFRALARPRFKLNWGKLLFLHWRIDPAIIRPLIPKRLSIDLFDGSAWVGVVPFTMWNIRHVLFPPIPWLSNCHELNVRTYVHLDGVPGVWFFSLDANSNLAVKGARLMYHLPYFLADIELHGSEHNIEYKLERTGNPKTSFSASWSVGDDLGQAMPESLEYFLVERYCLFSSHRGRLFSAGIQHEPWLLNEAKVNSLRSTMAEWSGIELEPEPEHVFSNKSLEVEIWPLIEV